jgi:hypothetical protein
MFTDIRVGRCFFSRKGRRVLHLEKHQHIAMTYHYRDAGSGCEFDVRDLPEKYLGALRDSVFEGSRAAHRVAITAALDDGYKFATARRAK